MSLVCTVTATPMATITWWYKGLLINNGSTMVSDIDMRLYFYRNVEVADDMMKSELILLRTNLDDNGTFQCIAENRAGKAVANFTLSVVIPFPPKPPQDVVEDRFQQEYIIAIGVAGVIVSILTIVIVILVAVKCRALRQYRRHSLAESKIHLYQSSASGSVIGSRASSLRVETPPPPPGDSWPLPPSPLPPDPDIITQTQGVRWNQRRAVVAEGGDSRRCRPEGAVPRCCPGTAAPRTSTFLPCSSLPEASQVVVGKLLANANVISD